MKHTSFDGFITASIVLILAGVGIGITRENLFERAIPEAPIEALPGNGMPIATTTQSATTTTITKNVEKTLQVGESFSFDGTKFTFVDVVDDSRCPIDVTCIWAGEFTARFTVGEGRTLELLTVKNTLPSSSSSYYVSITEVKPFPKSDQKINNKDYKATFLIERRK